MSDPVQNFEFLLKKQSTKPLLSLYSGNKQHKKHEYKPEDVISRVTLQLKAFQVADCLSEKYVPNKDIEKYKKTSFLCVNKLPVYEKMPKQSTKFDTQCVSDTQLINIIEDAEMIDVHRGMTQEFETSFDHYTEKQNIQKEDKKTDTDVDKHDNGKASLYNQKEFLDSENVSLDSDKASINKQTISNKEHMDKIHEDMAEAISDSFFINNKESNKDVDISISIISPMMCGNNIRDKEISEKTQNSNIDINTQLEKFSQNFNKCIEIEDTTDIIIEKPLSPIIMRKHVKTKFKTPSPLIFNLDKFEHFEKIAIPILETNDFKTAKQVINSQILDKELHLKIDEEIQLNQREILSPVFQNKNVKETHSPILDSNIDFKSHKVKDPVSDTELEFIELDKATSEDLISQIMKDNTDGNTKARPESEILKDEILFSSDEEENYVHKSYQDLPFTCALETSFYNRSDVLDKTMYVGFQTASNKTIQVFTDSFAQAKSLLSNVVSDEVTVTDLVKNCDSIVKNKTQDVNENLEEIAFFDEVKELNKLYPQDKKSELKNIRDKPKNLQGGIQANTSNFEGFKTASKKEIKLSDKALARCRKVFQDINISEDFDKKTEGDSVRNIKTSKEKLKLANNDEKTKVNENFVDDDLQNFDDVIIKEFENIEMSLEENKGMDKTTPIEFKTASNKDIQIAETALSIIKDVFKDINFDEELNEGDAREINLEENSLLQDDLKIIPNLSDTNFEGFKTASNKNITLSKEALAKTKIIFQDIDSIQLPDKSNKKVANINENCNDLEESSSKATFFGFKTANNKDIKISKQALAKTDNIFKDIGSTDFTFSKKSKNGLGENIEEDNITDLPSTGFVGFKTANNKNINISKEALAKTKKIFEDIDSAELAPKHMPNAISQAIFREKIDGFTDFNQPSTSKACFVGFKTANNKHIKISDSALAKTKNVFKDIDSDDFKFPEKGKNEQLKLRNILENKKIKDFIPSVHKMTQSSVTGIKTANNKEIKISDSALAKTTNIFKDIESDDLTFPTKLNEESIEENEKNADSNILSTNKVPVTGFKTANNKEISISKEALTKTKNIFKDIDSTDFVFPEKCNKELKTIESTKEKSITEEPRMINDFENLNPSINKSGFVGFKTAINKNIYISKESLAKTKNIFKDVHSTDFDLPEKANTDSKNVNMMDENCNDRDNISNLEYEMKDLYQFSTSKEYFIGFKTANNKKVDITKDALAKTKNIFKDIDSNDFLVSKKLDKELERTVKESKSAYPDLTDEQTKTTGFVGFKTANDKIIKISETALAKTKNIFKDVDTTEFQVKENVKEDYPNIETYTEPGFINNFKIPGTAVTKFQGFQTASNKQVKVSADALAKSKKIFQDIDVSENLNIKSKGTEDKQVLYKENKVLETDKDLLLSDESIDDCKKDFDGKCSPVFKGFQTANKKPVTISKEALAKSKKIFQDLDPVLDDPEPEFRGFKPANDKDVEISEKALVETKKLFENVVKNTDFKGFNTANEKQVVVSKDTLSKSRKIFQGIESHENIENRSQNIQKKPSNIKFGFKTGTNRDIVISEESVARSKRLFSEIDDINNINDKMNEENVSNIIDTQVLNNFEESLHTEDFRETLVKSKRSGSPILSCPRAKRRKKFETPYSQTIIKPEIIKEITPKNVNKMIFSKNYKKNKKYTLKDLASLTKDTKSTIDPYLLKFSFVNLLKFEFHDSRNEAHINIKNIDSLKQLFINSVNSKLIPNGWIENHLKLIIWKLISYEIKFKSAIICSAKNIIDQLKYRYDKELYNAQRPALRRILEKDDVPSKTIVLCVAAVYVDGVHVASATTTNNLELLLSDGWYCIKATVDKMLAQLVCQGKIGVGTKIVTNGAELVNCEQGMSPWEDTSAVRLKIFGNSTRRAKWDARLGYHGNGAILSQLSSVKIDGGKVSKLRVFVTRVYPALYVEKFEDGSTVTRSERLENLHQMKSEAERQAVMEKIYEEVEREFYDQESQDSEDFSDLSNKRTCLDSGSQIAKVMKRSKDPAEFRAGLTSSQSRLLEAHNSKHRERLLQDIQEKIRDKVEKAGVCVNRNVVTLLKIRVAGVSERSGVEVSKGMISIWKPTDAVLEIIKEGAWIDIMNVVPTAVRYSEIQISAGRQSVFSTSKFKEPEKFKPYTKLLKRNCFTIKDLAQNPSMSTDYNEIDTVGFIFLIDPSFEEFDSNKNQFQNAFLADADKNMICINFWGGLKKFGFQNVLDTGQIVACANLQKRAGNTRKSIPQYRVTEFSYFTKTPKNENARNAVDDLSKMFLSLDRRKFCEDCVVLKNNYSIIKINNENISPYRFNNSDYNMSRNKMFIDSPLARPNKIDDNFNLTGLDFESTFKQTDSQNLSEEMLRRKKKVNEKIARLKMYGEPPPLSTIHIINRSKNASNSYKSPLNPNNGNNSKNITQKSRIENAKLVNSKSDSSVINVTSVQETPEKSANLNDSDAVSSPVLLNRTYVKSVNPVKLNFDVKDNKDSSVDHFADDFDGSPPLSLD